MTTRRGVLGAIAGLGTVGLAGCSLLSDTIEQSAEPAGVDEETYRSAGYEHRRTDDFLLEQTIEVAGESRDLRLTNYVVEYGKLVTDGRPEGAQFVLFTSPSVTVADREANPFAQFDDGELLEEIVGRAEGSATDVRETGRRSSQVLDSSVVFRVYEATTMVEGQAIPLLIHFGRTSHDGDLLGVLGVYPGLLDESESIYELASATVHPAEFDS